MTEIKATLKTVEYPGAKQHASFHILKVDLESAAEWVQMTISGTHEGLVAQALFSSAIMAYGRCFTEGGSMLDAASVFKGNPRKPLIFHDEVMRRRHKVFAHNDEEINHASVGPLITDDGPPKILGYGNLAGRFSSFLDHDLRQFGDLIHTVLQHVEEKLATFETRLSDHCEQLSDDELLALPTATFTAR